MQALQDLMQAVQNLWQRQPYAVAAAVIAPIIFGATFALIWALSGSGGADPQTVLQAEPAAAPTPAAVQAESEPPADAQPAQSSESVDRPAPQPQPAAQSAQPAQVAEQSGQSEAAQDGEPPAETPLPTLDDVLIAKLEEANFRYGLEDERGSILPIGNGIVVSAGPQYATSWELLLPTARIRADIVQVGRTPRGAIGAPDNPFVVGWFNIGTAPGEAGNAILAGHRDYEDIDGTIGTGVCWELDRVKVGDQMIVRDAEQQIAWVYEVTEAVVLNPNDPASARYLAETEEPVVTLITCTGTFNPKNHSYSHRLVVVGVLQAIAAA